MPPFPIVGGKPHGHDEEDNAEDDARAWHRQLAAGRRATPARRPPRHRGLPRPHVRADPGRRAHPRAARPPPGPLRAHPPPARPRPLHPLPPSPRPPRPHSPPQLPPPPPPP